jgi:histidinol phosphatase-like PHP family hydrolase
MYNLHTHSLLSDGVLLPSEIAVRYAALGYKAIAITDHVDYSNIEQVIKEILVFTRHWPKNSPIKVLPGIELTHLPLKQFNPLAKYARERGIKVIIGHGETIVEPVIKGTNLAALEADIDILAHPGLITDKEVKLAKAKGIFLEVTTRKGHCNTNCHIVKQAKKIGARLILNHDSHVPEDMINQNQFLKIASKAGLKAQEINKIFQYTAKLITKKEVR